MTLEEKLWPTLLWMTHINMSQFDNCNLSFPLKKINIKNIVRDCHYVVIHSFHDVRSVFTRRKEMSYLPRHHVVQYLPCPAGSVVLHLLGLFKESKEKNFERARKQISDRAKDFLCRTQNEI